MASIFYSMAGEGRGHAVRARTLVERLRRDHEITLFASDEAYEFLKTFYRFPGSDVRLVRIPGLRFHYTGRKLDLLKSIREGLAYACFRLNRIVRGMAQRIAAERPSLIITDFEPALPRAAERCGVPYISVNHQHMLLTYDLSDLPKPLQNYAWAMSLAVRWYHWRQAETVVSSFYSPALKPRLGLKNVRQIGPLIREEIAAARPATGDHVLSYLRSHASEPIVDMLVALNQPVRVYGLGARPSQGQVEFLEIQEQRFVDDLAACRAVVSAAGNQLLGESLYLGKPFFAMPEADHHEQLINAHFLRRMGCGDFMLLEDVTVDSIRAFLNRLPEFAPGLLKTCGKLDGTGDALEIIRRWLPTESPATRPVDRA